MNLDKSDIKVSAATEIGTRIEDVLEGYRKEALRQEGASQAFRLAAKACEELAKQVDRDLDEGKLTADGPLEVAAHIKRFTERCANAARNLAQQSDNMQFIAVGKVTAMETSVRLVDKFRQEEVGKAQALRGVLVSGTEADSRTGAVRPGPSIKERRLAEERESGEESNTPAAKRRGRPPKKR